jgi:hypothetical protein
MSNYYSKYQHIHIMLKLCLFETKKLREIKYLFFFYGVKSKFIIFLETEILFKPTINLLSNLMSNL